MNAEYRPTRGRPPGPSLSKEAVSILERNALTALRGPNSRGAVPRGAFENIDVSTVDRAVKRAFKGESGRTPFDLASHQVCGSSESTSSTMEAVFAIVSESFRATDAMEDTLRIFLRTNFDEALREDGLFATTIVTAAACAHLQSLGGDDSGESEAAREIIEMRQRHTAELIAGFAAGLTIALRRLRRRPKFRHSMKDIVVSLMASTDGFIQLHHLQPRLIDPELVVETQWGIIQNLSEPGLLDPPNHVDGDERTLVEGALDSYASNLIPDIDALCRKCGVDFGKGQTLFPDDFTLAQRCMDYAVGSLVETDIAMNIKGAELAAVRDLLIATTQQAKVSPLLVDVVRRDKSVGFCAEARRHIAEALTQSTAVALDEATADGVALMLVDAAMEGEAGQRVWQAGLDTFANR